MIVEFAVQVGPFAHAEHLRMCRRSEVSWRKSETLIGCPFQVRRAHSRLKRSMPPPPLHLHCASVARFHLHENMPARRR